MSHHNRVLQFLRSPCPCCREAAELQRRLDRAAVEAERIELAAGDSILEFWLPSAERVLNPRDESDSAIRLLLMAQARDATIDEDLRAYAATELRRLSVELAAAADRIEEEVSI